MSNYILSIILSLIILGCQNQQRDIENTNVQNKVKELTETKKIKQEAKPLGNEINIVEVLKNKLSIIYDKNSRKYTSDTLEMKGFYFVIYGGFYGVNVNKNYMFTYIDSVKVVSPITSTLIQEGLGGYINMKSNTPFKEIIRVNDVNQDGQLDFEIYNDAVSGKGNNATYDVFLNQRKKLEFKPDFSVPNLRYDEKTNTYSSIGVGGHQGRIYGKTIYEYDGQSLKPIRSESQKFDKVKKVYIRTETDIKTNKIQLKEITYK